MRLPQMHLKVPKITLTGTLLTGFFMLIGFFLIAFPEGVFEDPTLPLYFNILGAFVITFPTLVLVFVQHRFQKGKEYHFLKFLDNISKGVSTGKDLASSLVLASSKPYGAASLFLRGFFTEVSKGMPLNLALRNISLKMQSRLVSRVNRTISDILNLGYDFSKALPGLVSSYFEIRKLRGKKGLAREDAIIKGYIVFLVFLSLFVSLTAFILPEVAAESQLSSDICSLKLLSLFFILLQSIYGGLVIGKISEGNVLAGVKHSAVHIAIASVFIRMFLGINLADMFLISIGIGSPALLCA